MTDYTAFLYVDAGTGRTHLLGWDPVAREWRVPCGLIPQPTTNQVIYSPDKPLCLLCVRLTAPRVTRPAAQRRSRW